MKKVFYLTSFLAFCFTFITMSASAIPVHVIFTSPPANDTVCAGTGATFSATAIDTLGGISTTVSYVWQVSTDGGTTWALAGDTTLYAGDSTDTLHVITSLAMNGYKFRVIASDTNGSATSPAVILTVIGIPPGTISGPASVCKLSSITLTDSVSGGIWNSNNPTIATITSGGVLTGHVPGYDTVTYTDTNACGGGVATVVIRVDTTVTAMPISGPSATCVSHYITLTNANVLGTWSWSTTNGNATITHAGVLSGVSAGMDTVFYVFTNACNTVSSAFVVEIDAPLSSGAISGDDTVCAGSWTHLTETVSGGTWLSSNSAIAVVDGSGNVTGIDQGVVTISYFRSNACGDAIATYSMHVLRAASEITGGDSVGVGLSKTLGDTVLGGTWSSADTSIATIGDTSGVVTGVAVGTTTITYTVTNFCGTSYAVETLHVGARVSPGTISGPSSVCLGDSITLTASLSGGTWHSSNSAIATVSSSGVVKGIAVDSGTAITPVTITYSVLSGFGDTAATYTVNVLHTPIIHISYVPSIPALAQNYQIKAVPPDGTWTHTNDTVGHFLLIYDSTNLGVAYATFVSYIMAREGTDTLKYHAANACGTADSFVVLTIGGSGNVGVNNVTNNAATLNIYPNPNQGEFTLHMATVANEQANVVVTNMIGEKIEEMSLPTNKLVNVKLDAPAGMYLISATTSSGKLTTRVTIAK